jgi:membrane associated rhomboid family serine protease
MIPLRDTERSYSTPWVTMLIVAVNAAVFLFELSLGPWSRNHLIATYGLVPARLHLVSFLTSMFLHGGWLHIVGNMWFLWIFGDNIEDILGHGKFLLFYLLCGVAAALAQYFFDPFSRIPVVGASGAIAGVMGAYMVKFPRARIVTFIFVFLFFTTIEIPAWAMLIYWFFLQLVGGFDSMASSLYSRGGGTAFLAHVGGFLAGMALVLLLGTRQRYYNRRDLSW